MCVGVGVVDNRIHSARLTVWVSGIRISRLETSFHLESIFENYNIITRFDTLDTVNFNGSVQQPYLPLVHPLK